MESKVVLITGGSSGIGKSIGTFLTAKGYTVFGTSRNVDRYKDFNDFELLQLDVNDSNSIKRAVEHIILDKGRLDILINNAGVGITGSVEETPDEEILKAFNTNFNGPIRMIKAVLPQMRKQRGGLIINITSIAGHMGLPFRGIYSASKGALGLITETLRMETKDFGVKVVNVAPGDFATNIASGRYHAPLAENSPYHHAYKKTLDSINQDVDSGEDPIKVALAIQRIIEKENPKVTYSVGAALQKFSLFLKRILPDKLYEKLLLNHYKL